MFRLTLPWSQSGLVWCWWPVKLVLCNRRKSRCRFRGQCPVCDDTESWPGRSDQFLDFRSHCFLLRHFWRSIDLKSGNLWFRLFQHLPTVWSWANDLFSFASISYLEPISVSIQWDKAFRMRSRLIFIEWELMLVIITSFCSPSWGILLFV